MTIPIDLEPLRAIPGELPPDGATSVAGIPVPQGRRLPMQGVGQEAFWAAPAHLDDPWPVVSALIEAFPRTGLWPMRIIEQSREEHYPWGPSSEFWAHDPTPPTRDGIDVLHARWRAEIDSETKYGDPDDLDDPGTARLNALQPWPGATTPATPGTSTDVTPLGGDIWGPGAQLVLVSCARPADAMLVLAPATYNSRPDAADTVAVLRSWEDRYGALPLTFGGDTLELALRRPPRTRDEAQRAACELYAFCSDFFMAHGDFDEHFAELTGAHLWSFWWD